MKRNILYIIVIIVVALLLLSLSSCNDHRPHINTSATTVNVSIQPFYQDMFDASDTSIYDKTTRLNNRYGTFFQQLCSRELRIGDPVNDSANIFADELQRFISYKENAEVLAACDTIYNMYATSESRKLSEALSYLRYYMPSAIIPNNVYAHFSAFNTKILVDSTFLSVSIDHYLGADCRFYPWLEIPQYASRNKRPENMAMDMLKALIYANFPDTSDKYDVLSAMIYQGKVIYITSMCMPDIPMAQIMGMTEQQLTWCNKAQKQMWGYMAETKLLYSTNPLDINKLTNDAPFTTFFGENSPGRAVLWCAYNIVKSYMENNPQTTMEQLIADGDAQQLLILAKYRP